MLNTIEKNVNILSQVKASRRRYSSVRLLEINIEHELLENPDSTSVKFHIKHPRTWNLLHHKSMFLTHTIVAHNPKSKW